jgi:transcription termination factor Rho
LNNLPGSMTKAELQSKHLSELHTLAADAGVPRYRMLSRTELIEKLSDGGSGAGSGSGSGGERQRSGGGGSRSGSEQRGRPPRQRRRRSGSGGGGERDRPERDRGQRDRSERDRGGRDRPPRERRPEPTPPPEPAPEPAPAASAPSGDEPRSRRRRRRRFGRRGKDEVTIQDLLLPPASGRQAILCAETREGCTALLRGIAGDLTGASKSPDPVVLLIDPSPEELAEWRREAPRAEIVAAGQARHATDALAQASARAADGDDVILLVDSLTRLAGAYGDAEAAKEFFDAGRTQGNAGRGSLTVVAALERPSS